MHTFNQNSYILGSLALKESGGRGSRKVWTKVLCWEGSVGILCVCGGGAVPRGEVTVSFVSKSIQTRILLRVKGGAINNYDRATGLNWDYPGKLGRVVTCLKREIDILLSSPTQTVTLQNFAPIVGSTDMLVT